MITETVYALRHRISFQFACGYYGFIKDPQHAKFYKSKNPATSVITQWRKRLKFSQSMIEAPGVNGKYYREDAEKVQEWLDNVEVVKCERTLSVVEIMPLPL